MRLRSRASLLALACLFVLQTALPAGAVPPAKPPTRPSAKPAPKTPQKFMTRAEKGQTLYATFITSKGTFVVKLLSKEAPRTVANFVGLATGEKQWTDPRTGAKTSKPLYPGTVFHRVIPNFMIQGGDPQGDGTGTPGFQFRDEFNGLEFNHTGILAMANRGPNTNGSQFFVTVARPRHLDGKHTIFGEVISGYPVVEAISTVDTGANNRPTTDVVIKKIEISDAAPATKGGDKKATDKKATPPSVKKSPKPQGER